MIMLRSVRTIAALLLLMPTLAHADPPPSDQPAGNDEAAARPRDLRAELPRIGLVESPWGMSPGTVFVAGTSTDSFGSGQSAVANGGLRLGGSPIDRLTIHGFVGRDEGDKIAPMLIVNYRFLGSYAEGYALGVVAQYKTEGFDELGGELEGGLTAGIHQKKVTLDLNLVAGVGLEEGDDDNEGPKKPGAASQRESDGELRARFGYDLSDSFRVGLEGQFRKRLTGRTALPGNRTWDALGGPQLMWAPRPLLLALSGGPSTMHIQNGTGEFVLVTVGAVVP